MKKTLTIIAAIMALLPAATAQNVHYGESFELNSLLVPVQSHEYTASDYIDLTPGFYSAPITDHQTILQLDSEGYSINPPEEGMTDSEGFVVGTLGGTVDVSAMGGLVYSIPIELPSGIHGMQPSLAITYNSQSGNGTMGWGWYLDGLSSITRTGKTLYHNGEMTAADLSWNDQFLWDGQRLVAVADYTDSIEYRTEQDGMSRIMAYKESIGGVPGFLGIKRIARFVVWRPDGMIMEYGATEDSWMDSQTNPVHPLSWQIDKVSDRNGNAVSYHYNESVQDGECYINTIEYTVNTGQNIPAQFIVSFQYEGNRQDFERYYIGDNQIMMRHLLKSITVTSNTLHKPLYKYEFQYEWNNNRIYNILTNLSMKSYDENGLAERVKATSFEYGASSLCKQLQYSTINSSIFDNFPFTGDFNGDGYTDVALVPYKDGTVYNAPVNISIYLNDRNHGFEPATSMNLSAMPASLDWIHVLDINGDGLDDLVPYFYDTVPSLGTEHTWVKVYINNPTTQSFNYVGQKEINRKGDVIIGDFNGDSNSDVILLEKKYKNAPYKDGERWEKPMPHIDNAFYLGYTNGQFQVAQLNTGTLDGLGPVYNAIAADYNGDGTDEVLLVSIKVGGTDYQGSKIGRFDFGDSSDCLKIVQSFERYYEYPYQYVSNSNDPSWCHVFPGDFNGDGKADILYRNLGTWRMCLSVGDTLGPPHVVTNPNLPHLNQYINLFYPSLRIVQQAMTYQYLVSFAVGDFDGDGCSDVGCTMQSNTNALYFFSKISTAQYQFYFRKSFQSQNGVQFHSQFIHVGNFFGRDNPSFLCSLQPSKGDKSGTATIHTLYSVNKYNALKSVADGLGNKTSFTYDYLTPKVSGTTAPFYIYNYSAPNAHGIRPVALPVMGLKTCSEEGVNGNKMITKYRYQNAMYHKYGHGFMGFSVAIAETYHNSLDSLCTTRKISWNESTTMGQYAMLLPQKEYSYVNNDGVMVATNKTQYSFNNVRFASGLTDLVVCPAMTNKIEEIYNKDEDDDLIATITTSYQYNYNSNHTYSNAYGCTSSTRTVTGYNNGNTSTELQTVKVNELQTIAAPWIVNRPINETVTSTRNSESISSKTNYTYASNNVYQPHTVKVIPNNGSQPNDPLTLSTVYEYDAFGNVIETTTSAPYGIHGEQTRKTSYEYGSEYQHRLLTKETKGLNSDGYVTNYAYDFHDRPQCMTDCNGKQTEYTSSIFGTDQSVFPPDGTEQRSLILWANDSPYKPDSASYYTWSKKTGGITAMTFYHKSGAELRSVSFDFQGNPVYVDKCYNAKGLLESVSAPYKSGELSQNIQWTFYHYDSQDRIARVDNPDGSIKTILYDGLETTMTITPPQGSPVMTPQTTVQKTNALGWLRESIDASGTSVFYEYYADGNLKWTRVGSNEATKIRMEYDHAGNRTLLHDPDYCTTAKDLVSVYNAFGEEVTRTTPKDIVTTFTYDKFGRMTQRTEDNKTTVWSYGETTPDKGLLQTVTYPGQTVSYTYDTCQRVKNETVQFTGGETHTTQYAYDRASRIDKVTYPSGVKVKHRYNSIGYPQLQSDTLGNELYRTDGTAPMGQTEHFTLGGMLTTELEYDPQRHLLTKIKTRKSNTFIQSFSFTYDGFCNLATRKDNMRNLQETFTYDNQNRLTGVWLGSVQTGTSAYDGYGRMTTKTADSQAVFSNAVYSTTAKPHAMDAAETLSGVFPSQQQNISYTCFDKVSQIMQGNNSLNYTYGYDHQRIFMEEHVGANVRTKRYVGNCEYVTETSGNTTTQKWLTCLTGPTGVYAVVVTENNANTIHYILKDNLGSWATITNSNGAVEQSLSYDAWGNLRNPSTWTGDFTGTPMFDRGYTGHEHLYNFGLINMNGRMYDPVMSSFLSADRFVQNPMSAQGFNRYAYCMNNPLRYIDPSGWTMVNPVTGYTPNSSANANDPYAYCRRPLEPRDICDAGVRSEVAVAMLTTFMYGNEIQVGGTVSFGDDGRISDIDLFLSFRYDFNQLNQTVPAGTKGKCVLMGLGSTKKYWQNTNGGKWGDGTKQWLSKSKKYMEQTGKDFSDPKNLIEFIQWNDADNTFKSYEAAFIPLSEVPDAILGNFVVAACSELKIASDIQLNSGEKGHFANVSRIKTYNSSIELDFIEPTGTNIMETFKTSSLYFYDIPPYLYNISFIKYRLKP